MALKKAILGSVFPERKAVATSNAISRQCEETADRAGSSTTCGVPGGLGKFFLNHPDTQNSVQGNTHPYTIDRIRADPGPGASKRNKDAGKQLMEELRRQALQAEGVEQKWHVEGMSARAVTVDMNRARLSPQQMVNLDRLALWGGRVRFTINDGVFKEPIEREWGVTYRGDYYPLHVNGEIKRITVIQPLKEMPTDPTSLQYKRETLQGWITSSIGMDPKSGKPRRELSFEPREPSQGKEVIHLSGLTPEERALLGAFNHISHESRPEGERPRQPVSWEDL